jgi:hypothetical protein
VVRLLSHSGGFGLGARLASAGVLRGGAALDYLRDRPRVYLGPNRAGPRGPSQRRTPEEVAAILADWRGGLGFLRLKGKWGRSVQAVVFQHTTEEERAQRNARCGGRGRPAKHHTAEQDAALLADWRAGLRLADLAVRHGPNVRRRLARLTTAEERRQRNREGGVSCGG